MRAENPRTDTDLLLSSSASLRIYVLTDGHRVKLIFNRHADAVHANMSQFVREVDEGVGGNLQLQPDSYRLHEKENGGYNERWTDVCAHALRDGELQEASAALRLLDPEQSSLQPVYERHGMVKLTRCRSKPTALYARSQIGSLEGVLIAFAVALFVVGVLLVATMCCIARRFRKKLSRDADADDYKTEPVIYHPASLYGTLPVGGFVYDQPTPALPSVVSLSVDERIYEWQEKSVDLNDGGSLKDYDQAEPDDIVLFP
ncbi:PREDICTED: uncharacterized protein LOC106817409 [Priapulus caudatus]|uniref:Uncharacterized protein LOC106817409 n=1 Tax=Priapulus caudatus TaxID=37621 RepID=A0ABM1EZD9_PRICU|nr:PREDICTED: uncharacterized protein LOC106817409 [Priapulus caudatus]